MTYVVYIIGLRVFEYYGFIKDVDFTQVSKRSYRYTYELTFTNIEQIIAI